MAGWSRGAYYTPEEPHGYIDYAFADSCKKNRNAFELHLITLVFRHLYAFPGSPGSRWWSGHWQPQIMPGSPNTTILFGILRHGEAVSFRTSG